MKTLILTAAVLTTICCSTPAWSENPEHIKQLLATKQCQGCDLSNAGLVLANLSGTNLSGADLSGANLSRTNLSEADLSGANLSGASLFGANLSGANLSRADLSVADLRNTYLVNADLASARLNGANWQGAIGITSQAGKAEDFYSWGIAQGQKGDLNGAINYFNQALSINPNFAAAYLARGLANYQLFNRPGAIQDAKLAEQLFLAEGNTQGYQTAQTFLKELQTPPDEPKPKSKSNILSVLGSIGSFLLQFVLL